MNQLKNRVNKTQKAGNGLFMKVNGKSAGGLRWKGKIHPQPKLPVQEH